MFIKIDELIFFYNKDGKEYIQNKYMLPLWKYIPILNEDKLYDYETDEENDSSDTKYFFHNDKKFSVAFNLSPDIDSDEIVKTLKSCCKAHLYTLNNSSKITWLKNISPCINLTIFQFLDFFNHCLMFLKEIKDKKITFNFEKKESILWKHNNTFLFYGDLEEGHDNLDQIKQLLLSKIEQCKFPHFFDYETIEGDDIVFYLDNQLITYCKKPNFETTEFISFFKEEIERELLTINRFIQILNDMIDKYSCNLTKEQELFFDKD